MILRRIVEFSERQSALLPTGYQPRFVTKEIALDGAGQLVAVVPLSGSTRGKRHGMERSEPQESPRRAGDAIKPRLFTDNINYVFGKSRQKDKPEKTAKRHQAWKTLIEEAAAALPGIPEVQAILAWVQAGGPEILREDPAFGEDDDITFSVNGAFVTDLPAVRSYWASQSAEGTMARCLVTGQWAAVVDRMPAPIKGVPDGQKSGTTLISVNNAAGESYGLNAALNSPISADAAEKVCNGLNVLLNESAGETSNGKRKFRYALRVGKAVFLAWCRDEHESNLLDDLDDPDPAHVQGYIEMARTGRKVAEPEAADFFMLSLSANAARIVVRDYHETTLPNVKVQLGRWFQRLELVSLDGSPLPPFGTYRLAASLYRDPSKEMPAHVPNSLMSAALTGRPIPSAILGLAVRRNLAMQGPFYTTMAKTKAIATSRLALIKASLVSDPEDKTLNQLNPEHPNPAYHSGRMLAVLEAIQGEAIPNLNTTLTDRFYGAACASPATVFGNLLKDATSAHLPKLRKNNKGAYIALDGRLQEVSGAIGDQFPRTLSLRDQALFALGFYHQKAHDRAEARRNKELRELDETTPQETETN